MSFYIGQRVCSQVLFSMTYKGRIELIYAWRGHDLILYLSMTLSTPFGCHAERGFLIAESKIRREVI